MIQGVLPQIESILAAGNHAFSNLNSQPWRFVVKGNIVEIHVDPERDQSHYNSMQRYSYFTIGGVLENISVAASAVGYTATISYFPSGDSTCIAICELAAAPGVSADPLAPEIFLRITNRKNFLPVKMSDKEKQDLINALGAESFVQVLLVDERKDVKQLAEVAALDDQLTFSNESLHAFFFGHISWTKAEDDAKKSGIPVKTLELSPFTMAMYYILQNWQLMNPLSQLHFEKIISGATTNVYATAAAMGAIVIPSDEPKNFVLAGRAFTRLWLTVTKVGLSMQPLNGIPYLKLKVESNEPSDLSPQQKSMIESGYATTQKIFATEGKRLACVFRIGGGATPSGHSSRRDLSEVIAII